LKGAKLNAHQAPIKAQGIFMKNSARFILVGIVMVWLAAVGSSATAFKDPEDHTRSLMGRVFSRQDQPLQKAIVYLKNTKSLVVKTYITDPDGGFRFSGLSPNVDYEVYAEHNGARSDTKTLSAFDTRRQVNITLRVK
jgi:Carboxypeptidase regulatory-like domain